MSARVSRPVQHVTWSHCPACGLVVLETDCEESLPSFLTRRHRVDPTPVSAAEEVACVLTGRPTWAWAWRWEQHYLDLRSELYWSQHDQEDAGTRPVVLPEHLCGGRFPTCLPAAATARRSPAQPEHVSSHQPDLFKAAESERELASCPF
jgi:hypothetical protein